jgi:hypothetical protein
MEQDEQFLAVKNLIDTGNIKEFKSIFLYVYKTDVNKKTGGNYNRFLRFVKNPKLMTFKDVYNIAHALKVTPRQISDLIHNQIEGKKK